MEWYQKIRADYGDYGGLDDVDFFREILSSGLWPIHLVNMMMGIKADNFKEFWLLAKRAEARYNMRPKKLIMGKRKDKKGLELYYYEDYELGDLAKDLKTEYRKYSSSMPPTIRKPLPQAIQEEIQEKKMQKLQDTKNQSKADSRRKAAFRLAEVIKAGQTKKLDKLSTREVQESLGFSTQNTRYWIKKWQGYGWINHRNKGPGRGNLSTFTIARDFRKYVEGYKSWNGQKQFKEDFKRWMALK